MPLDDAESNYLAVKEHLLSKVPISEEQIHTIDVSQLDNPDEVADEYEKQLVATFVGKNTVAFPRFDLIVRAITL